MTYQPMKIEAGFEARLIEHYAARRRRLMSPANAVKDVAPSRPRVEVQEQHDDKPALAKQAEKRTLKTKTQKRIAALRKVYRPGMSTSEIADRMGTTKNAIIGLYKRNPDELRSCPLLARSGRAKG